MGGKIEYDSDTGLVDVDGVLGGMGTSGVRSSTGLYTVTYESKGKDEMLPFAAVNYQGNKAIAYAATKTGCSVKTMRYISGTTWSLADFAFCLYLVGV